MVSIGTSLQDRWRVSTLQRFTLHALPASQNSSRDDTLEDLKEKLKAGDLSDSDVIKVATLTARYTLPAVAYDEDLIFDLMDATVGVLPDDQELVIRIKKAWVPILAAKMGGG